MESMNVVVCVDNLLNYLSGFALVKYKNRFITMLTFRLSLSLPIDQTERDCTCINVLLYYDVIPRNHHQTQSASSRTIY